MEYIINPSKNGPHFRHPMPFHGVSRQGSSGKKPPSICLWSIHRPCGKYESLVDGVGKIGLGRVKTLKREGRMMRSHDNLFLLTGSIYVFRIA